MDKVQITQSLNVEYLLFMFISSHTNIIKYKIADIIIIKYEGI